MTLTLQKETANLTLTAPSASITLSPPSTIISLQKPQSSISLAPVQTSLALSVENDECIITPIINRTNVDLSVVQGDLSLNRADNLVSLGRTTSPVTLSKGSTAVSLEVDSIIRQTQIADFIVDAYCQADDAVGDLVFVDGDILMGRYQVTKADITDISKMPVWAVIVEKTAIMECQVQWFGFVENVYTGLTVNAVYFVGDDAKPTTSVPNPGVDFYLQKIGHAVADDVLLLKPDLALIKRVLS